ncbi:hypothetical protein [Aerosakkonema sp. BLCC-F183]|uniref:hypothetical protein n=1 Tax=Aerosakkonema sp. BLCC-F183 TaxID=3342834 RepID=UPI0035BC9519
MLYLALSCLQGRTMQSAAEDLLEIGANNLQLTPGNVPTPEFNKWLQERQVSIRKHHGFHWEALRRKVWSETADCLVDADSVHPPQTNAGIADVWKQQAEQGNYAGILLETMYPGYCLGDGDRLSWAMDIQLELAVDVSHIYIQICQNALDNTVWERLQNYENIGEIHISANHGKSDIHQPITEQTFGLEWLRDRTQDGTPAILECYMHRLTPTERRKQVELLLNVVG